jgi:DNA helicase-2/ATP-dependent DNA helicase PcrA
MWTKRAATTPTPRSASRSEDAFSAGDKVRHRTFGEGVVINSSGAGGDTQVTVAFSGHGVKRLMLSFAPLEKVVEEESKQQYDPDEDEIEIQDPDLFAP